MPNGRGGSGIIYQTKKKGGSEIICQTKIKNRACLFAATTPSLSRHPSSPEEGNLNAKTVDGATHHQPRITNHITNHASPPTHHNHASPTTHHSSLTADFFLPFYEKIVLLALKYAITPKFRTICLTYLNYWVKFVAF